MEETTIALVLLMFGCLFVDGQDKIKVGLKEQRNETTHEACTVLNGELPSWLEGDFVRQACGSWGDLLNPGKQPLTYIDHLFDCISMVAAFTIKDGSVTYSTKYYDTRPYNIWSQYGKDMTKSKVAWETAFTDFDATQVANWSSAFKDKYDGEPSVSFWRLGDQLTGVTETDSIMLIDTKTYDSLGPYPFKDDHIGQPKEAILVMNPAHEQVDQDGTFYSVITATSFTSQTGGMSKYIIYKITDGKRLPFTEHAIGNFDLTKCTGSEYPTLSDRPQYMHSFVLTENYFILPATSYLLDYCKLMAYQQELPIFKSFDWHSDAESSVLVFEKQSGKFVAKIQTPAFFATHQFNAFEKDGMIHMDMLAYPNAEVYYKYTYANSILSPTSIWQTNIERFNINASDWTIARNVMATAKNAEFSGINNNFNGKEYKYGYFISGIWSENEPRRIVKMTMETGSQVFWEAPENLFPQEPVFVPRPGATAEDDGVLVIGGFNSDTEKGFMIIIDAKDMKKMYEVQAPLLTPIGIHNRFYPSESMETAGASQPVIRLTAVLLLLLGLFML